MGINLEYQHFIMLPSDLNDRIERSVYNCRKRGLFYHREQLRKKLSAAIIPCKTYYIVDSMPLEICKLSRSTRSTICKEEY
ncbi:MAG: IS982 family transposase, partial [Bacteroidales bacterium]|nr:IS982 family transposase [Bacteroidales bacterium]